MWGCPGDPAQGEGDSGAPYRGGVAAPVERSRLHPWETDPDRQGWRRRVAGPSASRSFFPPWRSTGGWPPWSPPGGSPEVSAWSGGGTPSPLGGGEGLGGEGATPDGPEVSVGRGREGWIGRVARPGSLRCCTSMGSSRGREGAPGPRRSPDAPAIMRWGAVSAPKLVTPTPIRDEHDGRPWRRTETPPNAAHPDCR